MKSTKARGTTQLPVSPVLADFMRGMDNETNTGRSFHMKKMLSVVIATLMALSFSAAVFAADAAEPGDPLAPAEIIAPAGGAQKDAKTTKAAKAKAAKAKVKADAKAAKAKAKADAKAAKDAAVPADK